MLEMVSGEEVVGLVLQAATCGVLRGELEVGPLISGGRERGDHLGMIQKTWVEGILMVVPGCWFLEAEWGGEGVSSTVP